MRIGMDTDKINTLNMFLSFLRNRWSVYQSIFESEALETGLASRVNINNTGLYGVLKWKSEGDTATFEGPFVFLQ